MRVRDVHTDCSLWRDSAIVHDTRQALVRLGAQHLQHSTAMGQPRWGGGCALVEADGSGVPDSSVATAASQQCIVERARACDHPAEV